MRKTAFLLLFCLLPTLAGASAMAKKKPSPAEALVMLQDGNSRFVTGKSQHPHSDNARLIQAGKENQGDHAIATILSCSDSRVPLERIFDVGIMDIFVIRIAGNVVDTDEAGSIEYGLAHVNTPLLVVLGHTQCGAVTAVTQAVQGHGHPLECNIPPLVDNIEPAVKRAIAANPKLEGTAVVPAATEENIWQGIEDLFLRSPATRNLVKEGKVKVVGAVYDVATGKVSWLPEPRVSELLARAEASPKKVVEALAGGEKHAKH